MDFSEEMYGTQWIYNSTITETLIGVGEYSTPTVFNMNGVWYLISGEKYGTFFGYSYYIDTTSPYFTTIPANASLFYGNQSLSVTFVATDNYGFGYYSINDTRFLINQTGFLSNATPMAAGNYEINVTINDTSNNINWTRYKVQINKSNYGCNVLFNASSPLAYPNVFIAYSDCGAGATLYRNSTTISNNSVQNSGASYYNFTIQRTDTANYTNTVDTKFFTVIKSVDSCYVYFNTTSPQTYPNNFIVYTNCTSSYALTKNGTSIYNGSVINSGATAYSIIVQRADTANYTNIVDSQQFIVNKNNEKFNVLFNASSPLIYPDTFLVYANATSPFVLTRNGTTISNNSVQNNGVGYYNFTAQRNDTSNYTNNFNTSFFTINKVAVIPYLKLNDVQNDLTITYLSQANASAYCDYGVVSLLTRNITDVTSENNINITLGANYYLYEVTCSGDTNHSQASLDRYVTVNKNPEICQIFYNETSPLEYTNKFKVWSNCSTAAVLKRNNTVIANNSAQSLSVSAYNFSFSRNDTQNYSYIFSQSQFIIGDTTPPVLTITHPSIAESTFTVGTVNLNYTVSDAGIGLNMCWYQNNTGANKTIACGANTTISQATDGTYTIYMWANDSYGNLASTYFVWEISTNAPAVNLKNPTYNKYLNTGNDTVFNFTSTDGNGISFAKLYTNSTGSWDNNDTLNSVVSGVETNFKLLNFTDGYYIWNVWSNDSTGLPGTESWAAINNTFTIDTIFPVINITYINPTIGSQFIFSTNITDINLLSCRYAIFNSTGYIDASASAQGSFICNTDQPAGTIDYGTYNLTVYATDKAGNQQYYWIEYTNSPTAPIIILSGSGGGGAAPTTKSWYMSTEAGVLQESTQTKTFQLSMLAGGSRDKYIYFYNNGTANRTISLTCTGSICDDVYFSATKVNSAAGINSASNVKISVILPEDIAKGDYSFNIIGTDENSLSDIITVTVSVGAFGIFTEFINKITTNATIFGLQVPYILILILIIVVLSALLYLILRRKSWGLQTAIITGIIGGLVIVYFL